MKEMVDSGYVEIQNHTYNLHISNQQQVGIKKRKGESESDYQAAYYTRYTNSTK